MRFLILFFFIFSFSLAATPAKVVGVIPVKFNSKGRHAPLPYNQQLMQRGWVRVPTINQPFIGTGRPRYQPTKVTKASLSRGLGYAAGRVASLSPATKAMLIAYGAYEANCITQNYPSLCMNGDLLSSDPNSYDVNDFVAPRTQGDRYCSTWAGNVCGDDVKSMYSKLAPQYLTAIKSNNLDSNAKRYVYDAYNKNNGMDLGFYVHVEYYSIHTKTWGRADTFDNPIPKGYRVVTGLQKICPPIELVDPNNQNDVLLSKYTIGPINSKCHRPKPTYKQVPITPEWIEQQIDDNPEPFNNNTDVGLGDFVDWETGLPRPDIFENPTYDSVSDAFADAAESIANGTVQHTNPSADNYVPSDLMPQLLVQINNWHEGNAFIDVFNNKQINPDVPTPPSADLSWDDFPGITKSQYESSNNSWANSALSGQPSTQSELDKILSEQQKLTDFINAAPPANPFDFNLVDFLNLPTSGGCRGFTLDVSILAEQKTIRVDQHCPPYNAWGMPVVSWLLSIFTVLTCFQIFRRTLEASQ